MATNAVFFDLSGVIYEGDKIIEGAVDTLQTIRRRSLPVRFVTNTATKSREQILTKLAELGVELEPNELFTAPDAALAYIQQNDLTPYVLVHDSIAPMFTDGEIELDCVVLGDARERLNYASLNRAFQILMQGKPLIGIGDNRYFSDGEQLLLDAGPFIHALGYAADTTPIIMGKPSQAFFRQVLATVDVPAAECLMVGDDIYGDIEGALNAGLQALLVRTGKYQPGDESRLSSPAHVVDSIVDVVSVL